MRHCLYYLFQVHVSKKCLKIAHFVQITVVWPGSLGAQDRSSGALNRSPSSRSRFQSYVSLLCFLRFLGDVPVNLDPKSSHLHFFWRNVLKHFLSLSAKNSGIAIVPWILAHSEWIYLVSFLKKFFGRFCKNLTNRYCAVDLGSFRVAVCGDFVLNQFLARLAKNSRIAMVRWILAHLGSILAHSACAIFCINSHLPVLEAIHNYTR